MEQAEKKENIKLGDEERAALIDARLIDPEKEELTPEEYEMALEALRQKRLAEAKDAVERLETGLPNAAGVISSIRAKQQRVHRPPNTPQMPIGDPSAMAAEEWAKYEAPLTGKSAPVKRVADVRQKQAGPRVVQLDPTIVLKIELLAAKKRAAVAEERLAALALQEARKSKQETEMEEAELMKLVSRQLNLPPGKNIRLLDREKGICQVE